MGYLYRIAAVLLLGLDGALARQSHQWGPRNWKSLVTFGDSYTDDSRLGYFASHSGEAPPVGWVEPVSNSSASGGYTWGYYVAQTAHVNRYNYAVSGAVCSNKITPRWFSSIDADFPSVLEYEIPAYVADSNHITQRGKKFLDIPSDETIYAIWIGTNDLGNDAFLTDSQVKNATIPDYIECVYDALDKVYANGGRYFVIMNAAPLQLSPQYATPADGGLAATQYWPDKGSNLTEISYRMWESVTTVNNVFQYKTPYEVVIADRYPGAQLAVMDTYGLISHIYYNPTKYLAAPANVTGYIHHCNTSGGNCEKLPNAASFLWYDELHPSERTDQVIGKEFVKVVQGISEWATYW
ncbi:hypothetical protein P175DRAFT_0439380 [Aspergillus ochraceoroseus IBT 24754]|uniref:SGNH hydrolase-type esterase domain-containing protein n=2 Tax=Aspergillus ochraceoroseus TaxID=138278 RepID=A0A2T5LUL2_9EURO|nr:uncharacterized protein P175DRAFT_0439380 [Aspergillus ochraceoroseus IBT 24754]KKK21719.1 hypothetical protein AOCH_005024 [Aspergillus ochraceoroseus]PTU19943.1 hypothetical protein P175DRAFT_0439380 [Aspergillus ochraceoroseus IBT 24754]